MQAHQLKLMSQTVNFISFLKQNSNEIKGNLSILYNFLITNSLVDLSLMDSMWWDFPTHSDIDESNAGYKTASYEGIEE